MLSRSLLPSTSKTLLMVVVVSLTVCMFAAAVAVIFFQSQTTVLDLTVSLTVALILLATALGLWRLHPVGRGAAVFLLWMAFILDGIVLLGTFNPFWALEYHHATGKEPPTAAELALQLWPFLVAVPLIVFALHVLGKHKSDFTRQVPSKKQLQAAAPSGPG